MSEARRKYTTWLAGAYLLLQIAVPAVMLLQPRPARFGWQMFSGGSVAADYVVEHDGFTSRIDPTDFVALSRADIDLTIHLPAHLCEVVPGARAVRVTRRTESGPETTRCAGR